MVVSRSKILGLRVFTDFVKATRAVKEVVSRFFSAYPSPSPSMLQRWPVGKIRSFFPSGRVGVVSKRARQLVLRRKSR